MTSLEDRIKQVIISSLNPEDIDTDAPLFGDGLGLDSIDALELGLAIKSEFGVTLAGPTKEVREHFKSVATLADFIRSQQKA